jgi:hypothetical protein
MTAVPLSGTSGQRPPSRERSPSKRPSSQSISSPGRISREKRLAQLRNTARKMGAENTALPKAPIPIDMSRSGQRPSSPSNAAFGSPGTVRRGEGGINNKMFINLKFKKV